MTATGEAARPAAVAPGGEFEVTLTLTIKDGFHIYAYPAGSDDVIPTVVTLAPGSGAELVGVRYPAGESKVLAASGPGKVAVYEKGGRRQPVARSGRLSLDAPAGRRRSPSGSGSRPATTRLAWPRRRWRCRSGST